jgi:hypothetical protein
MKPEMKESFGRPRDRWTHAEALVNKEIDPICGFHLGGDLDRGRLNYDTV